jgi:hypothetical protein
MRAWPAVVLALAALASPACGNDRATAMVDDPAPDDDPLAVRETPAAGSLDDLHQRVIAKRCSGQPGLCHNGQFEPNLSTPALTYAYLVGRPSLEKTDRLRVRAGDPDHSLLIDKLRNRNGVSTQMPLGADPLLEADIQALEAWITGGALRAPGATPAPVLNNPPHRPEIAIFDATGTRLDGGAAIHVAVGATLTLRHSVQDFETPDDAIPFAAVVLGTGDGRNVVLEPTSGSPQVGRTAYDAAGPISKGDRLDYLRNWTVPATLTLYNPRDKTTADVSPHGVTLSLAAIYIDSASPAIAAFDTSATQIQIQ